MTTKDTIIQEDGFGFVPNNLKPYIEDNSIKIVRRYTLTNKSGASVRLITWGAGVQSIKVPNKRGILGDVALGFDNIDGYLQNRCIGRLTNRVAIGFKDNKNSFSEHDDKLLFINEGRNDLDNVNWDSYVLQKQVIMSHVRQQEGYSGMMLIQAKYSWTDENELKVNICATATEPTPVNITNYCPLNLAGHGMGAKELKNHVVTINADKWISLSTRRKLSSAKRCSVDDTIFDLRNPTRLKNKLYVVPGGGYDHNFCVNSPSKCCYRFHGRVLHPESGRFLELYSDQPGVQFYTENSLPDPEIRNLPNSEDHMWGGCEEHSLQEIEMFEKETKQKLEEMRGKNGVLYRRHGGFSLSPQSNPARILYPGKLFEHNLTYKFGVK